MDISNFSLLSALYGSETRNLYNEVYFPIIRYSLFFQMKDHVSSDGYSKIESLKDLIHDKFDISIPIPVLRGAIRSIGENDTDIEVFEEGNSFKIAQRWADSKEESISLVDLKAAQINEKMSEIEEKFQVFIKEENIKCEFTFTEFFSNHTSELLLFLNGDRHNEAEIEETNATDDAKFANLMQFVIILRETVPDLYEIAETFFWSSVVAAFLQRDQNILKDRKEVVNYYFDTSLILALLDLADEDSVNHAIDLKEMIENAGHVVCVHPMTLREIKVILKKIADNGVPDSTTPIFEAYHRRNLNPTTLLQIGSHIREQLEKQQVVIYKYSESDLDQAERKYKYDKKVYALGKLRTNNESYSPDFREIHDVFMGEFIAQQRKTRKSLPSAGAKELDYFLTKNSHLIGFFHQPSLQKEQLMMHPRNVVANLWINGALSKDLCRNGLSEIISRCLSANHVDARSRMAVLVRYSERYIEDKEERQDFCRKAYKQIVRQSNIITPMVDEAISTWNEDRNNDAKQESLRETMVLLVKEISEEDKRTNGQLFQLTEKVAHLEAVQEQTAIRHEQEIKNLQNQRSEQDRVIANYSKNQIKLEEWQKIQNIRTDLLKELSGVKDDIKLKTDQRHRLEQARDNSITNKRYNIELMGGFLLLSAGVSIFLFWHKDNLQQTVIASGLSLFTCIIAIVNLCRLLIPSNEKKDKYREKQRQKWEIMNPVYTQTCEEIGKLDKKQNLIETELFKIEKQLSE